MNPISDELRTRIAAWLDAAVAQSGLAGPAAAELRRDLETHILEALARRSANPASADLDAVLGEMDPPSSFGVAAAASRAEPAAPGGGGSRRWWYLALAALALNAWGVWRLGRHPPPAATADIARATVVSPEPDGAVTGRLPVVWRFPTDVAGAAAGAAAEGLVRVTPPLAGRAEWASPRELRFTPDRPWPAASEWTLALQDSIATRDGRRIEPPPPARVRTAPLMLLGIEQAGLTPARELTLRLRFNAPPQPAALTRYVEILAPDGTAVEFGRVGDAPSAEVLVKTAPVAADRIRVRLRAGLPPATGTLALPEPVEQELVIAARPRLAAVHAQCDSYGPGRIEARFTAEMSARSASSHITIEPPVKCAVEPFESWEGAGLRLLGDFRPGAVYTVTFGAGLATPEGATLGAPESRRVQIPHRPPAVEFSAGGRYLAPAGPLPVRLTAVNVEEIRLEARPLVRANLVYFALREEGRLEGSYVWSAGAAADSLTGPPTNLALRVADVRDEPQRIVADLRDLAGPAPRGAWLLTARARDLTPRHHLVVVTDLGLTVRRTREGALIWVTSLRDAQPVAGAVVTLFGRNNTVLARAETDADGVALLAFDPPPPEAEPFLATAERDGDLSFLRLTGSEVIAGEPSAGARPPLRSGVEAFVFSDRGIYRPGETARVHAIVRDHRGEPPEPFPVALRLVRSDGLAVRQLAGMLDPLGAADFTLALPEHLRTGPYELRVGVPGSEAAVGACNISVEDFVPPRVECAVELPAGRLAAGAPVPIRAAARHLFGRAAEGLPAEATLVLEPARFAPPGHEDWTFGDPEREFPPVRIPLGRRTLDADGCAEWSAPTDAGWRPPAALRAVAAVTVIEAGGRPFTAVAAAPLDPVPDYIGLRPAQLGGHVAPGEALRVEVALVAPDGSRRARDETLRATLAREEWAHALRRDAEGVWSWRSERVLTTLAEFPVALTGGHGACEVRLERGGAHVFTVASAAGAATSLRLWGGGAEADRSRERPDRIELEPDRPAYAPGDRARVAMRAPFAGLALVTLESDTVLERRLVRLDGAAHTLEFDLREEHAPGVYAVVSLLQPARPQVVWSPRRAVGAARLPVAPPDRRLAVEVRAPPETRPAGPLRAELAVRDERGEPAAGAALVVAAVDEAILRLTDFATPDPWAFFHGPRAHAVEAFDLFSDLIPLLADAAPGRSHTAGDGGAELRRRLNPIRATRFRPLALRAEVVSSDSNGAAQVAFDLPEFAGRLRLFAVAYDRRRCGSADASVTVRRPLVVQTALPRFLAPGDRCEMGVYLYESGRALTARVRATARGPLRVEGGDREVRLDAGGRGAVAIPVAADASPGAALCSIEVVAGDERVSETIELPVRPAAPRESRTFSGLLAPGDTAPIRPPERWLPESLHASVWFGARPTLQFAPALDDLLRYPYGCLEQTVSAAWPLLAVPDLRGAVETGALPSARSASQFIAAAIERVLSMQMADGGFREWPESPRMAGWAAVYAAHFLVEAQRAGHAVPEDRLNLALERLRARLETAGPADASPTNPVWQDHQEQRAYVLEVLALAGRTEASWTARMLEFANSLRPAARAHLGAALALAGRPREARALAATIEPPALRGPAAADRRAGGCLNSRARDAALALALWARLAPDAPEAAAFARALLDSMESGRWATTLENASALVALGRWLAAQPDAPRSVLATLRHGDRELARVEGAASSARWSSPDAGTARDLVLVNHGPGPCHYGGMFSGVPARAEAVAEDRGLVVRRAWLRPDGELWGDRPIRQGDQIIVRLELAADPARAPIENVVVEELLPAGFELDDPALEIARRLPWLGERRNWLVHREARDDRLVLFCEPLSAPPDAPATWHYSVRAVTPGRFAVPAARAEAMYDPTIRSVHGGGEVEVLP